MSSMNEQEYKAFCACPACGRERSFGRIMGIAARNELKFATTEQWDCEHCGAAQPINVDFPRIALAPQ